MNQIFSSTLVLSLLAGCAAGQPGPETPPENSKPVVAKNDSALQIAEDPDQPDGDPDDSAWGIVGDPSYHKVVNKVVGMTGDPGVRRMAQRRGLGVMNVMWEDTGRAKGSSLGPNISDLTLQVRFKRPGAQREQTALMPVIRFPNFSDRTGDVPADKFFLRMGNEKTGKKAGKLRSVPLTKVLKNVRKYLSVPRSVLGSGNLLAKRDSHFLVSAQAVFLPIPKKGKATFNPVLFNYQSAPGSPAVMSILVTRQGTSITVVENLPEDGAVRGVGQELYFNNKGQRTAFTAERKSEVKARIEAKGGPRTQDDKSALAKGADVLFLIQVPLKHKQRGRLGGAMADADGMMAPPSPMSAPKKSAAPSAGAGGMAAEESDVEQAVLGHGRNRGPFTEGNGLKLERDPKFPIRITVQFYKATSNGVVSEKDLDGIAKTIGSVYEHADFVGSLVVPQGDRNRPTEWQKMPAEWFPW